MNIELILKKKFHDNTIGHFYIIEPGRISENREKIYQWTENLVSNLFECKTIVNHEDFLQVAPSASGLKYTLDDFKAFFDFLRFKATRASRKIIIIKHADMISTLIANKLLKTLEEPPVDATIFLINDNKTSLLETMLSRGIKIRVPINNSDEKALDNKHLEVIANLPIHQIVEKLKNSQEEQKQLLFLVLKHCIESNVSYTQLEKIQKLLNEFQEDSLYHNAATHRLYAISSLIKDLNL